MTGSHATRHTPSQNHSTMKQLPDSAVAARDKQRASFMRIPPIRPLFGANGRDNAFAFMIHFATSVIALPALVRACNALHNRHRKPDLVLLLPAEPQIS